MAKKAAAPKSTPGTFHGQLSGAPSVKKLATGKTMPSTNPQPFAGQLPQTGTGKSK